MALDITHEDGHEGSPSQTNFLTLLEPAELSEELKILFDAADKANELGRGASAVFGDDRTAYALKHRIIQVLDTVAQDIATHPDELIAPDGKPLISFQHLTDAKNSQPIDQIISPLCEAEVNFPTSLKQALNLTYTAQESGERNPPKQRTPITSQQANSMRQDVEQTLTGSRLFQHYDGKARSNGWADRQKAEATSQSAVIDR